MKKSVLLTALLVIAWTVGSISVLAQKDREVEVEKKVVIVHDDETGPFSNIPDLSDAQRENIKKLQLEHQKKVRLIHATLKEKRAHLETLRLADKPDMQQINKTIDEIAGMQADLMKERESHRQAIRSKLNEEQKEWFDSKPMHRRGFGKQGPMEGFGPDHRGNGCCKGECPCFNRREGERFQGRGQMRQARFRQLEEEEDD